MFKKILIANRGEIALRIVRAVHDSGSRCVAVYAQDDAQSPHVRLSDEAVALNARGPSAYLDITKIIEIALKTGCDAVHPGYGFLSERADFARACEDVGIRFIGPSVEQLALFGDKARARSLAQECGVPLMPGSTGAVSLEQAMAFFAAQNMGVAPVGVMIKAIGGGGGRGMRAVLDAKDLPEAYARCVSEARAAFDVDGVYVERLMPCARHVEIQIIGDGKQVMSLGERECSLQRRFQKLVEIAPSPSLSEALRQRITHDALKLAQAVGYQSLGTFEFLVTEDSIDLPYVFIEANPRLQVEHTVTEQVTGLDLVQLQIGVSAGRSLVEMGLDPLSPPQTHGFAVQWRINAETLDEQGQTTPSGGSLERFDLPSGPGVRVDTHGYSGFAPSPHYDTLLAKLIVHSRSGEFADVVRRARRALAECQIDGVATNLSLLQAISARPEFSSQQVHTRFVETNLSDLLAVSKINDLKRAVNDVSTSPPKVRDTASFGVQFEPVDHGVISVVAPMPSKLVQLDVAAGDLVPAGGQLAILEAMKMEHVLLSHVAGRVVDIRVAQGDYLAQGQTLVLIEAMGGEVVAGVAQAAPTADLDEIRPDLQHVIDRHAFTLDANRTEAVARRRKTGSRTARENIVDLCDLGVNPDSFIEYGALAIAAQSRRRSLKDLTENTPADGLVTGLGSVNASLFGPEKSRCAVMAYDYTVLAGTQGVRNHKKTDRMLDLAHQFKLPVVLFAEGGGGRPGDTDMPIVAGLNNHTFSSFAALSGKVPVVGIVSGRCFAGNAALLGCADVIIATENSNIGMSGPAMIEGGGLGSFTPEEIGPSSVQAGNGVIDILVKDEEDAVRVAKQYLSYFQGAITESVQAWQCTDQRQLRHLVPENRLRVYDMRAVMQSLVDNDSLLELRAGFGAGILTALARIEGRALGIIANNPKHLGGAIDVDAADKAARFMQLCNAHGLPIVSLTDTPGFMVGPAIEAQAQVRHVCRMFVVAAHLSVPFFSVVLRKGYGLGAQAMTAGGFDSPVFTVSWPTGEFGAMGLEGYVRLGFRKELEAAAIGPERDTLYKKLLDQQYDNGQATNMAAMLEIDAVIDPAQTRSWVVRGLQSTSNSPASSAGRFVDSW